MGADSHWSSPLPWGTPSITSTRTTRRASSFSARRWAAVAPTLPAPTTVILLIMGSKAMDSFPLSTTWRGGQGLRSPAPCVHLPMGIGAQRVDPVERAAIGHAESLFGPAIGATLPRCPDQRRELLVRGATAQRGAQIDALPRVETQEPRSVRRDAAAVAGAAERRGDRGDDPEGGAVRQAEPLGGGAPVTGDRSDRAVAPCQRREHVALRHDLVHGPVGGPAHVHVLDEAQLGALGTAELEQLRQLEFGRTEGAELRFIEYMDVGGATHWSMDQVVSQRDMLAALTRRYGPIAPIAGNGRAPAERFRLPDGTTFGIIASVTAPFCRTCDRSRVTADGTWFLCLYAGQGVDLRAPLRGGASDEELAALIRATWQGRTDRGAEERLGVADRGALYRIDSLRADPHREMHTRGG